MKTCFSCGAGVHEDGFVVCSDFFDVPVEIDLVLAKQTSLCAEMQDEPEFGKAKDKDKKKAKK